MITQNLNEVSVLGSITDELEYVEARYAAEKLAQKTGLNVADMPALIQALTVWPNLRKIMKPGWIDTLTCEYHGLRNGLRTYEVWNSAGTLSTAEGLERGVSRSDRWKFMPISRQEWSDIGRGEFGRQGVPRVHLEDVTRGDVPLPGTPFTIYVRLDKDKPRIQKSGLLEYDAFMHDDRVLMITGSPEARAALAKIRFGGKNEGGDLSYTIGNYHRIEVAGFSDQPRGRLTYLINFNDGIGGVENSTGQFALVGRLNRSDFSEDSTSDHNHSTVGWKLDDFLHRN